MTTTRSEQQLLIAFADLTRFRHHAQDLEDPVLADLLDAYYRFVEELAHRASGQIIKFIGDEFLAIWISDQIPAGLVALPIIKREVDAWWTDRHWDSRLVIKAHIGQAIIGTFGNESRFDVIGNAVTVTASLPARTISLSADAYAALAPAAQPDWTSQASGAFYTPRLDPA